MPSFLPIEIQQLKKPTKLDEKSRRLRKLRKAIDQGAPSVLGKFQQAKTCKQEYLKAVQ